MELVIEVHSLISAFGKFQVSLGYDETFKINKENSNTDLSWSRIQLSVQLLKKRQ
jgi:hypothetical protein